MTWFFFFSLSFVCVCSLLSLETFSFHFFLTSHFLLPLPLCDHIHASFKHKTMLLLYRTAHSISEGNRNGSSNKKNEHTDDRRKANEENITARVQNYYKYIEYIRRACATDAACTL